MYKTEIELILSQMKNGHDKGDGIVIEAIKHGSKVLIRILRTLFNLCLEISIIIPEETQLS